MVSLELCRKSYTPCSHLTAFVSKKTVFKLLKFVVDITKAIKDDIVAGFTCQRLSLICRLIGFVGTGKLITYAVAR